MTRRIAVCDCETDPFKPWRIPRPFVWGFFDGVDFLTFKDTKKFIAFLKDWNGIVYAHNGGKFDWHFLLSECDPYEEIMLINGRIARMPFGAAELRDSYSILPVPLAAYKKDDIDYAIMEEGEREKPKNWRKIIDYLGGDCRYLFELVERFITDYGMNLTMAGASMKQWKKIAPQSVPETTADFYDKFFPYYYGGRVECFCSGVLDIHCSVFDINSAYPYAMLQKHPYSDNYSHVEHFEPGADFYTVRCESKGAFPYRHAGEDLSFPADNQVRTFSITGWEYAAAIDTQMYNEFALRKNVTASITFVNHVDFTPYIDFFWQKRGECTAAGDEAGRLYCKLFMNSLYGKFAANPRNYRNYMVVPPEKGSPETLAPLGWRPSGEFGPWILAESDLQEEQQRFYNVATGASITGFVRAMLWRAIHSSKGVIYCDTDSLVCEQPGDSILLGSALGQWKHEGDFDRAGIGGKKCYILRGVNVDGKREYKVASKGVRLSHSQLWSVARGGTVDYVSSAPTFRPTRSLIDVLDLPIKQRSRKSVTEKFFTARTVTKTA